VQDSVIALTLLILASGAPATVAAADWEVQPVAPGAMPEIASGGLGLVHLAWPVEGHQDLLYYAALEEDGWDISILPVSDSFAIPIDLSVGGDGTPHIAFHEHHSGNLAHVTDHGMGWRSDLIMSDGHDGWVPSISLGPDDTPHLVGFDGSEGVEHATPDGSTWAIEPVGTGPLVDAFGAALAVDGAGRPTVCYHDGDFTPPPAGTGSLHCATRDTGGWSHETVDTGGNAGKFVSLAFDAAGGPHLAYLVWETSTTASVRYARRDADGWVIEQVVVLNDLAEELRGANRTVSMALDEHGRPHIAASDTVSVVYAVRMDGQWFSESVVEQTTDSFVFGQYASLAIDAGGRPHIAYYELENAGRPSSGTVYHATTADHTGRAPLRPSRRVIPIDLSTVTALPGRIPASNSD
jgi:hypothetical protein